MARTAYTTISLPMAIFNFQNLYLKKKSPLHNKEPLFSKEEAFEWMDFSLTSGYANNVVGALTQYGIIRKSGSKFSVSELGQKIIDTSSSNPTYRDLLKRAQRNQPLFSALLIDNEDRILSSIDKDELSDKYGVPFSQLDGVIKAFNETVFEINPNRKPVPKSTNIIEEDISSISVALPSGVKVRIPKEKLFQFIIQDLVSTQNTLNK